MKKMKEILNKNKTFIIPLGVILTIFLLYITFNHDSIFIFSGDSFETMYQFYIGGYEKVHSGGLLSFDFTMGLGANPLYNSFYFLFSPFFYLTCLLPKSLIDESFLWMTIIKLAILYGTSVLWLNKISNNRLYIVCGSLLFTLSGWVFFYSHYVFFLDHLFVLPLLLYFTEKYINDKRWIGLVLTVSYLSIVNYYFAYLFLPFVCLYGLYRALVKSWPIKQIAIEGLKFVGYILLGIGLGALIFIPNIIVILTNPRFGVEKDLSVMSKYELFKLVTSFFMPVTSRLDANLFISDQWTRFVGWGNGVSLYMGAFTIYITTYFLFIKRNKEKLLLMGLMFIAILIFMLPIFSYILQGTMDTRWYFYFSVIFLMMMKLVFDEFRTNYSRKKIVMTLIVTISMITLLLCLSYVFKLNEFNKLKELFFIEIVVVLLLIVYASLLFFRKKDIIVIVVVADILFSGYVFIKHNEPLDSTYFIDSYTDAGELKALEDGSFYRINQDGYAYWPSNNTFAKNINGLTFYNSIYNFEMDAYLNRFKSTWSMPSRGGQDIAQTLLGVKYWVTKTHTHEPPYGYYLISQNEQQSIYQNSNHLELGFGYSQTINSSVLKNLDYFTQDLIMQKYLVTETSLNTNYNIEDTYELIGNFKSNEEIAIIDSIWDATLIFNNINRNDVTVELYYNGAFIKSYSFYDQPYFTIPLHENYFIGEIKIINNSNHEMEFDYYHMNPKYFDQLYNERKEISFKNTTESLNYISGEINLANSMTIYTSIPYDLGWDLYVDGHKQDYQKVHMGFIGFELNEGFHEVEFKYKLSNVSLGFSISMISLAGFVLLFYMKRGKQ